MPVDPRVLQYFQNKFNPPEDEEEETEEQGFDGQRLFAGVGDSLQRNARNQMRIHGVNPEGEPSHEQQLLSDREKARKYVDEQQQRRDNDQRRSAEKLYEIETRNEDRQTTERRHQEALAATREANRAKAAAEANKPTVGQESADREYGKNYNSWTSGGAKAARTEIGKLQSVANNLRDKKVTTGGMTGAFPDRFTSNEVLQARADVQSTIMNSLRAILGAQFTEKEGERILRATWNEADSTENNMARINRLITDLTNKADDNDRKAQFFEQNGTLRGYQSGAGSKPKRVIQNGHEYILNEQTGEYE